jgi:hypothetical protein
LARHHGLCWAFDVRSTRNPVHMPHVAIGELAHQGQVRAYSHVTCEYLWWRIYCTCS